MVHDLKEAIPARYRRWVPEDKVWRVHGPYAPTAILLRWRAIRRETPSAYTHHAPKRVAHSEVRHRPSVAVQKVERKGTPATPDDLL